MVGTAVQDQKLELQDPSTGVRKALDDETQSLKQLAVSNHQILVVIDTSKEKKSLADEETSLCVKVGDRCQVAGPADAPVRVGVVAFIGSVQFTSGLWVGVKFDEAVGKNDGSVNGVRYFECEANHGSFVKPANVYPTQAEKKCCSRC
jgi:tubulin-folding cofactor B